MPITVTLYQQRTNEGPSGYKIFNELQVATGMAKEIFVHKSEDDTFHHVAVPSDFFYPIIKDLLKPYYRKDTAEKFYPNVNLALEFAEHVKYRVSALVDNMNLQTGVFEGDDTTNYPTPP